MSHLSAYQPKGKQKNELKEFPEESPSQSQTPAIPLPSPASICNLIHSVTPPMTSSPFLHRYPLDNPFIPSSITPVGCITPDNSVTPIDPVQPPPLSYMVSMSTEMTYLRNEIRMTRDRMNWYENVCLQPRQQSQEVMTSSVQRNDVTSSYLPPLGMPTQSHHSLYSSADRKMIDCLNKEKI